MSSDQENTSFEWLEAELQDTLDEDFEIEFAEPMLSMELRKIYRAQHPEMLDRKVYFRNLLRLQAELIKVQDWVQHTGAKVCILFEGREVVLGPRAGDHYLVVSGLEEGERVVVQGAFKIDSALQIQAAPSMMNPDGGQKALTKAVREAVNDLVLKPVVSLGRCHTEADPRSERVDHQAKHRPKDRLGLTGEVVLASGRPYGCTHPPNGEQQQGEQP